MTYARIDKKGYYYHIFVRGQRKQPLFFSKDDMGAFINMLKQVLDETDIVLCGYCLMRNHFHLIVYRRNVTLGQFMQKLLIKYAMYFNDKYDTTGHVYQGRFGSKPVLNEARDLPRVFNYVHYNPVGAVIVNKPSDYEFSSAGFYEGKDSYIEQLKKVDFDQSITDRDFETYRNAIGTKEEYLKFLKRKPGREMSKYNERRRKELDKLLESLLKEHGLTRSVFEKYKRRSSKNKKKIKKIIKVLNRQGYTQARIADLLNVHKTTINKMLKDSDS